jgi:hypothetical protein
MIKSNTVPVQTSLWDSVAFVAGQVVRVNACGWSRHEIPEGTLVEIMPRGYLGQGRVFDTYDDGTREYLAKLDDEPGNWEYFNEYELDAVREWQS